MMDEAETDVPARMGFPKGRRTKLRSANPHRQASTAGSSGSTDVVGIFPDEDAITRLAGALLPGQNDERAVQRTRTMTLATIAAMADDPLASLSAVPA